MEAWGVTRKWADSLAKMVSNENAIASQFAKNIVNRQMNDAIDAGVITIAIQCLEMHFVKPIMKT